MGPLLACHGPRPRQGSHLRALAVLPLASVLLVAVCSGIHTPRLAPQGGGGRRRRWRCKLLPLITTILPADVYDEPQDHGGEDRQENGAGDGEDLSLRGVQDIEALCLLLRRRRPCGDAGGGGRRLAPRRRRLC